MENVKRIAFTVRRSDDIWECTRSCIGVGIENFTVGLFLIRAPVLLGDKEEDFLDYFEMIRDLEGNIYSDNGHDADRFDHFDFMPLQSMARELTSYDLVISF